MKQGYNDRMDDSLGNRDGKESSKEQNYKDRRDEAKAMNKAEDKRAYQSVESMDKNSFNKTWAKFKADTKKAFGGDKYANGGAIKEFDIYSKKGETGILVEKSLRKGYKWYANSTQEEYDELDVNYKGEGDMPEVYVQGKIGHHFKSDSDFKKWLEENGYYYSDYVNIGHRRMAKGGGMFGLGSDMMSKANIDAYEVYDFMYDKLDEDKKFKSAEEVFDAINERYATGKVYNYSKKSVEAGFNAFKKDNYAKGGSINNYDWKSKPLTLRTSDWEKRINYPRSHNFNGKTYNLIYNFDSRAEALRKIKDIGMTDTILQPIKYSDGKGGGLPKYFVYVSSDSADQYAKGGKIFNLDPVDGRKSFYGKAKGINLGNTTQLQSYDTIVAEYDNVNKKMTINDYYSPTTARHINSFLDYYGYPTMSKSEMLAVKGTKFEKGGAISSNYFSGMLSFLNY